jgi:hypothetical protein
MSDTENTPEKAQPEDEQPTPSPQQGRDSPSHRMPSDAEESDDENSPKSKTKDEEHPAAQPTPGPSVPPPPPASSSSAPPPIAASKQPEREIPPRANSSMESEDYSRNSHDDEREAANRNNAGSRNTELSASGNRAANSGSRGAGDGALPPIADSTKRSQQHSQARSGGVRAGGSGAHTPIAAIRYPPRQEGLTVADFLDASKPLVKSSAPLTRPKGPSFVEESNAEKRRQRQAEQKMQAAMETAQINSQRVNERKYLKAQYEFEREKQLAERTIYHKERVTQWAHRFGASPLGVDLVADNERIEEESYVREMEEKRRKAAAERKKQKIKRAIIVKALAEVPLLEEARRQKRELVEEEKRDKALRDVQRVEAVQDKKLRDQELLSKERQAKLDQRIMANH